MWLPEKIVSVPGVSSYYNVAREYNGALYYPAPGTLLTSSSYDSWREVMYSVSSGRLQQMQPCAHYKRSMIVHNPWVAGTRSWYNATHVSPNPGKWIPVSGSLQPVEGLWNWSGPVPSGISVFGTCFDPVKDLAVLAAPDAAGTWVLHPEITGDEWNIWQQEALKAMLPGIKADLSLPNALYELKDFRTVRRSFARVNKSMDEVKHIIQRYVTFKKGNDLLTRAKSLRAILKGAADVFLQGNFNVAPLLSDATALQNSMRRLRLEFRNLVARAGQPQERHFKKVLYEKYSDTSHSQSAILSSNWVVTSMTFGRSAKYVAREFNATIRYRYRLPNWSQTELGLSALIDKLGINFNPAIIWNAIPWSFVVDWVLGVSRWLDQFQTKALEPTVHIDAFCCSVKVSRTIQTSMTSDGFSGTVLSLSEDAYERKVGLDRVAVSSSIRKSGLNLKEFSLSSALLLSR